ATQNDVVRLTFESQRNSARGRERIRARKRGINQVKRSICTRAETSMNASRTFRCPLVENTTPPPDRSPSRIASASARRSNGLTTLGTPSRTMVLVCGLNLISATSGTCLIQTISLIGVNLGSTVSCLVYGLQLSLTSVPACLEHNAHNYYV